MKILFFGRGVISTQYAWAFEKAGHEVNFYVRPGRSTEYGSFVNMDIIDGRQKKAKRQVTEQWGITLLEEIPTDHDYDLIFVSVRHTQLDSAISTLSSRSNNATILICNNYWGHFEEVETRLPQGQVIWGFPGAGGRYSDGNHLIGGFLPNFFLEKLNKKKKELSGLRERYEKITTLFMSSGFKISKQSDMQSWLWGHFIMNAAMMNTAAKVGSIKKIFETPDAINELIKDMDSMKKIIVARGGQIDTTTGLLTTLPLPIAAQIFKLLGSEKNLTGKIMLTIEDEINPKRSLDGTFAHDVYIY